VRHKRRPPFSLDWWFFINRNLSLHSARERGVVQGLLNPHDDGGNFLVKSLRQPLFFLAHFSTVSFPHVLGPTTYYPPSQRQGRCRRRLT